jgi:hypothetical protein
VRVTIVAQESVLYTPELADYILTEFPDDVDVRGILPLPKDPSSRAETARYYLDLLGPFAATWFGFQVAKRKLLDLTSAPQTVESVARDHQVPLLDFEGVNDPDHVRFVRDEDIDVVISLGTDQAFGEEIREAPNQIAVWIRHGDEPGSHPGFWALKNGEDRATVTVHEIVGGGIGPILAQGSVPIEASDTWDALRRRFTPTGTELLIETLRDIDAGTLDRRDPEAAHQPDQVPTPREGKDFRKEGGRFL